MRGILLAVAALLALIGLVWIGQGAGYIKGSFMTGDTRWLTIGAVLLVVSVVLAGSALVLRRSR